MDFNGRTLGLQSAYTWRLRQWRFPYFYGLFVFLLWNVCLSLCLLSCWSFPFWCSGILYILGTSALCDHLYSCVWHKRLEGVTLPAFLSESILNILLAWLLSPLHAQIRLPLFLTPVLNFPPTIKGHSSCPRSPNNLSNVWLH